MTVGARLFSELTEWIKEQKKDRKYCIFMIITTLLSIVLLAWFSVLFQYSAWKILRYLVLFWILSQIAWTDYQSRRIPNKAILSLWCIRSMILLVECLIHREDWMNILVDAGSGLLLGGAMLFLCYLITGGGVGAGDVKLFAAVGYQLGAGVIFSAIFLTVLLAAIYCIIGLAAKRTGLKQKIAFAPFIWAGTVLTMLLGV